MKDVDAFHPENVGRLVQGRPRFLPCTPQGVQQLLVRNGIEIAGRHVVILGRSEIVGRPLSIMLSQRGQGGDATVTVCHSRTRDLAAITRSADILDRGDWPAEVRHGRDGEAGGRRLWMSASIARRRGGGRRRFCGRGRGGRGDYAGAGRRGTADDRHAAAQYAVGRTVAGNVALVHQSLLPAAIFCSDRFDCVSWIYAPASVILYRLMAANRPLRSVLNAYLFELEGSSMMNEADPAESPFWRDAPNRTRPGRILADRVADRDGGIGRLLVVENI